MAGDGVGAVGSIVWAEGWQSYRHVWDEVKHKVLVFSALSLAASVFLITVYAKLPRVRRMPGWVVSRAACCELVTSLGFVLLYFAGESDRTTYCEGELYGLRFMLVMLIVLSEVAAYSWRLVMYLHLLAIYLNPFNPERLRFVYRLIVAGLAIGTAISCAIRMATASRHDEKACSSAYFESLAVGLFLVPFCIFVIPGTALTFTVRVLGRGADREAMQGVHPACISSLARQRAMRHSTAYLLLYSVQLTAGLAAAALVRWGPNRLELVLWSLVAILACGRPAASLLGWLVINDIIYVVFGVFSFFVPNTAIVRRPRWLGGANATFSVGGATAAAAADSAAGAALGGGIVAGGIGAGGATSAGVGGALGGVGSAVGGARGARGAPKQLLGTIEASPVAAVEAPAEKASTPGSAFGTPLLQTTSPELAAERPSCGGVGEALPSSSSSSSALDTGATRATGTAPMRSESSLSAGERRSRLSLASELQDRLGITKEAMARRAAELQGIEEVGFKEELRFELLYYVAHAIGELAHCELFEGTASTHGEQARPMSFLARAITGGGIRGFAHAMMTARGSATAAAADADAAASDDDAQARGRIWSPIQLRRTGSGSGSVSSRSSIDSRGQRRQQRREWYSIGERGARHYGVDAFRTVRAAFGISAAAYARAFPSDLSEFDPSWRQRLKELVSEGASGSFFYRVLCNASGTKTCSRFIIKQITKTEKDFLISLLPAYRDHVVARKGHSLIQYFGCHSMPLWWRFSGKVYFVVMRDFLPVRQWLTFDLKGATANRRALHADHLHMIHAGEDPRGGAYWGTLRDWEWMDIAMVCDISAEAKASLSTTIAADASFLAGQGILDYSLLVGIHRLPAQADLAEREKRLTELEAVGGYVSLDRHRVFFFGIIDVLEHYSMRWRVQRCALNAAYCFSCKSDAAEGISALPPQEYADRFVTFVNVEVLQCSAATLSRPFLPCDVPRHVGSAPATPGAREPLVWPSSAAAEEASTGAAAEPMTPTSAGSAPSAASHPAWAGRCCGLRGADSAAALHGAERWTHLWERRRRGLVRERIEAERNGNMRRIADLEAQLRLGAADGGG